jgi:hypothetical protein
VITVIRSRVVPAVLLVAAVVVLASCAAGPNPDVPSTADAGFWLVLWQGVIVPITFVISLFTDEVNVYEVDNTGNWYDFGFVLGLSISFGGSAGGSAQGQRRRSRRSGN